MTVITRSRDPPQLGGAELFFWQHGSSDDEPDKPSPLHKLYRDVAFCVGEFPLCMEIIVLPYS